MSIKPEDILPDTINEREINGVMVRKGSMGAALANADILANPEVSAEDKQKAKEAIKAVAPALIAIGLHKHIVWKNPSIQKIFDETFNSK